MDSITSHSPAPQGEIRLREILLIILEKRWIVIWTTLVFTGVAIILALVLPKSYKAEIIISPVSESSSSNMLSGLGSLASQFSGLASIAGLSSLTGGSRTAAESQAVLKSEALSERYINEHNLLPTLFPEKWDNEHHTWKHLRWSKIPTSWTAFRYFDKHVRSIAKDPKTELVTLTIVWTDPRLAAQWANDLVKLTNSYQRDRAITEADRNIAYLKDQAAATDVVPIKQAIYSLMQAEIDKAMVARGSDEYSFKVIDPAVVPKRPSSPILWLWTLAGTAGGLILSVFTILFRAATK